jgi:hypothetical protein
MTSDLTALARELVEVEGWEWAEGMHELRIDENSEVVGCFAHFGSQGTGFQYCGFRGTEGLPDLTHDGLGGILLARLGPRWSARRVREDLWHVTDGSRVFYAGPTLAAACAEAIVARRRY